MQVEKKISSLQNPLVKQIRLLQEKSRERKKTGLFVVEGLREVQLALKGGYEPLHLLYTEAIPQGSRLESIPPTTRIQVTKEVYHKIAYRGGTEGVLAIFKSAPHALNSIDFRSASPLILVAEAPEKPGNIGALLRTADAANLDAVLIANPKTDLYNPNIIRSSVGCLFTNQVAMGTSDEIVHFLDSRNIKIFCAALSASTSYVMADFTRASAIVVGTEATGLSKTWLESSYQNIKIPMQGEIDSMNVSVSAAILIFEGKRQRGFR